ncbi:MAG: amidohydrolase family protein [Bilophila wadsworthia]
MGRKVDSMVPWTMTKSTNCRAYPPFHPLRGRQPEPSRTGRNERVAAMGFRGVGIDAGWLRRPLYHDDPVFDPIYAKCQELGMIVSLTSSFMLGPDLSYSEPCAIQRVAMKYPNMKIVVPHGCWPHVHTALAVAIRCPNVYLMPLLHYSLINTSDEYIKAVNTTSPASFRQLLPGARLSQCLRGWKSRGFTDEALQNTLYDNAARLLGEK